MHGKFNLREHHKKFAPTFRTDTDTWVGAMAFVGGTPVCDVGVAAKVLGASPYTVSPRHLPKNKSIGPPVLLPEQTLGLRWHLRHRDPNCSESDCLQDFY